MEDGMLNSSHSTAYRMSAQCLERLANYSVQVRQLVESKDYERAHSRWNCAIGESQFRVCESIIIADFFKGITIAASTCALLNFLQTRDQKEINFHLNQLETCFAQLKLARESSHPLA